jgi:hypothetical protein
LKEKEAELAVPIILKLLWITDPCIHIVTLKAIHNMTQEEFNTDLAERTI